MNGDKNMQGRIRESSQEWRLVVYVGLVVPSFVPVIIECESF